MTQGDTARAGGGSSARTRRSAGRLGDPEVESRVFEEALQIFAEVGWGGFTLSAVAARSTADHAVMTTDMQDEPNTGSIRKDLISTVESELRM